MASEDFEYLKNIQHPVPAKQRSSEAAKDVIYPSKF